MPPRVVVVALLVAVAACARQPPPVAVGGTVGGLQGTGLVLRCSAGGDVDVTRDGPFACPALAAPGSAYQVEVAAQPSHPAQTCAVAHAAGSVPDTGVAEVAVTCTTNVYRVSGDVTGLAGSGLVLLDRGADPLPVAGGTFTFPTAIPAGQAYDVTVAAQPTAPWQTCTVAHGAGILGDGDVSDVAVSCVTNAYRVRGQVNGLAGQGLLLVNRGTDDLAVAGPGAFAFASPAASGTRYDVAVKTQPVSPWQTCAVTQGEGTVGGADVGDVAVSCATNRYALGGSVTGLVGGGLVLQAGSETLPVSGPAFTFPTRLPSGADYSVSVQQQPTSPAQVCTVSPSRGTVAGGDVSVAVACAMQAVTLDLAIDGAYVTQGAQSYVPSVPLVAGRAGLLRVFVRASEANSAAPAVDVRLLQGGSTVWARTIPAPGASVPTSIDENDLGASWNLPLASADLPAGDLAFSITVNPGNAIAEAAYANDALTLPVTAYALPTWRATLVPVVLSSGTGNVTDANLAAWVDRLRRVHPIAAMDVRVASAPFTPSVASVTSDGTGWSQILSELEAKRSVEASDRYYFGALHVPYASGVAGLGYTSLPSAIGWDRTGYSDGGNFPEVLAHEVGHNFGRLHAPCGNPASVDPSWPTDVRYQNALIGVSGWDASPGGASGATLKDPATTHDIMGYCPSVWASDYTYKAVLAFRRSSALGAVAALPMACLLVSGTERDGAVQLRPAFRVDAVPTPAGGSHRLELRDALGATVREVAFEPVEVADLPQGGRHFTLAIPVADLDPALVQEIAVTRGGQLLASLRRAGGAPGVPGAGAVAAPEARRDRPGSARITWDQRSHPRVMIRDPATGEVLGFAEGGNAALASSLPELELHLSDGVGSERRLVQVR